MKEYVVCIDDSFVDKYYPLVLGKKYELDNFATNLYNESYYFIRIERPNMLHEIGSYPKKYFKKLIELREYKINSILNESI